MYESGKGVREDHEEAVRWYRVAAEQGYPQAQSNLGRMYALGQGIAQDYIQAYMWYTLAAFQLTGDDREKIVRVRDLIGESMTSEQLTESQSLAREWKPKGSEEGQ